MTEPVTVYLSGPMSWRPQFNVPLFDRRAHELREAGFDVISPAEEDGPEIRAFCLASPDGDMAKLAAAFPRHGTVGALLGRDVRVVIDVADAVAVLPEWEESKGARLEVYTAALYGKRVYDARELVHGNPVPLSLDRINSGLRLRTPATATV